ncbi:MAG: DNA-directed RNA polymerase subunit N [Candidatus Diapherotrites archaeon]|nr:DNA-directed RNA polymerase subunit N [Candidatus Diapherotrites archaeon]
MITPIRCFSCGNLIGNKAEEFAERIKKEDPKKVLDELGIKKSCCRRMLLSHVELIDDVMKYDM